MPFTLAHPAAILPLRGLRYLRTAPLIIGAMIPDLPYYVPARFGHFGPETHSVTGSFTTCMVRRVAALSAPVIFGWYNGTVCHVLQYLSSAFGLAAMTLWYRRLPAPLAAPAGPGAPRSSVGPVLTLVAAAAILIGAVQATQAFTHMPVIYRTLDIFLTRSLAWFAVLYLVAGTVVTLEQEHDAASRMHR